MSALLDFSTAFDTVRRKLLLNFLHYHGLLDGTLNFLKSYFKQRYLCVRLGGQTSAFKECLKKVPHGSILGCFFFLYILVARSNVCLIVNTIFILTTLKFTTAFRKIISPRSTRHQDR